jgi:hypothetical protein
MTRIIESLATDPHIMLGAILGTLAMLSVAAISIAAIVSHAWQKVRLTEDNNSIKHALLSQGMSADEIATVVCAWPSRRRSDSSHATRRQREAALASER